LHRETFTLTPDYLSQGDPHDVPWPYEYMFQLTYANRAIKTWAAIARLGRTGVRQLVTRHNALARELGRQIAQSAELELLAPVSLSVVNFCYVPESGKWDATSLNRLNTDIARAINASGEAHLATTRVRNRVSLRVCFLHYENNEEDVAHLLDLVHRYGRELQ